MKRVRVTACRYERLSIGGGGGQDEEGPRP